MPELGLELVRDVDRERFRSRLPRWDPRLWGDAQFSKNTRPGNRLLKLGLAWGRERVKARKLQQENVTPRSDEAPVSRFTGKEEDVEVGLQYFGKRYLSPYLGRWISADPLAVHAPGEADLNLYAYVHGNVLIAVDPLGLEEVIKQLTKFRAAQIAIRSGAVPLCGGAMGCKKPTPGSLAEERKIGRWVQKQALASFGMEENGRTFESQERVKETAGSRRFVQPDGVADIKTWKKGTISSVFGLFPDYPGKDSSMWEVKTYKEGSTIHLSDSQYQIKGLVDAASQQEASKTNAGFPPILHFVTTAGVTVGLDVIAEATKKKVLLVHHVMEEVTDTDDPQKMEIRTGAGKMLNSQVLAGRDVIPAPNSAGSPQNDGKEGPEGPRVDD